VQHALHLLHGCRIPGLIGVSANKIFDSSFTAGPSSAVSVFRPLVVIMTDTSVR